MNAPNGARSVRRFARSTSLCIALAIGWLGCMPEEEIAHVRDQRALTSQDAAPDAAQLDDVAIEPVQERAETASDVALPEADAAEELAPQEADAPETQPLTICAGIAGLACHNGLVCVDDPSDGCTPPKGVDCLGMCVDPGLPACGGVAGLTCGEGDVCADEVGDTCLPEAGAVPCPGKCVKAE